jgi:hypothetical protein
VPLFARYNLAFALQLRKKHGKTSVRVAGECQLVKNVQNVYGPGRSNELENAKM